MPITELRIEGMRTIERIRLGLDGLTVLIGDNGSGKSSILEACEILRRAASPSFLDDFHRIHGGLSALLRRGATKLVLGATVQLPASADRADGKDDWHQTFRYEIELTPEGSFATFRERLWFKAEASASATERRPKKRDASDGFILWVVHEGGEVRAMENGRVRQRWDAPPRGQTWLSSLNVLALGDPWDDAGTEIVAQLHAIQVHLPFEVIPAWASRALDRKSALRGSSLLAPADQLDKLGVNLGSAFHALKNSFGRAHWDKTVECVRMGLGEHIEDVVTWADPGGGNVGLSIKLTGLDLPIPTSQLSDGMLSYLAFVALFRLDRKPMSLLAFDEPDLHLHPQLLMRVLDFFEAMAEERPVLLATHSDRMLDGLRSPEKSVVLCDLGPDGTTRLLRPDPVALARWLERYRGLGDLLGAGHSASVLTRPEGR